MMSQRTVCTLFIITALEVAFSYAGLTHFPPIEAPKHLAKQPGCYSDLTENILPYGREVTPTAACVKLKCLRSKFTEITTCDLPLVGDGCHIQKNKGTFPACCDTVACNKIKQKNNQEKKSIQEPPKATKQTPNKPVHHKRSISNKPVHHKDSDTYDSQQYNEYDDETNTDLNRDTDYYYIVYDDLDYTENDTYRNQYYDDEYGIYSDINGYVDYNDDPAYSDVDYNKYGEYNNEYNEYEDKDISNIENKYPKRSGDYYDYPVFDNVDYKKYDAYKNAYNEYDYDDRSSIENKYRYKYDPRLYYGDEYDTYYDTNGYGSYYNYPPHDYVDFREKSSYKNKYDENENDQTPSNKNIYPYIDDDILYYYTIDDARVSSTENDALTEQKYEDNNLTDGETNIDSNYDSSTYAVQPNSGNFKQADADTKIEEDSQNHNTADTKVEYKVYPKQNNETENKKDTGSTDDSKNDKDTDDNNRNTQENEQNYPESDKSKVDGKYYTQRNTKPSAKLIVVTAKGGNVDKTTINVGSDSETTSTGEKKIDLEQAAAIDEIIKKTTSTGNKKIDLEQAAVIDEIIKDNTYIRIMETLLETKGVSEGQAVAATQAAVAAVTQNNIAKATTRVGRSAFAIAG